ncbi:MAG: carboxypeptidase-like regulatory domain-containing protein [Nitrospirae bacterium]|nr:carboxypeptidase-like regulatory domain-containing protein [Nitrospirota bacterium]
MNVQIVHRAPLSVVCSFWCAACLLALVANLGCSGGKSKGGESASKNQGTLPNVSGELSSGGAGEVTAALPPGTGAVKGSVKAEGGRAIDLTGAEQGVRGGVRGSVRGMDLRGAEQGVRAVPARHPVAEGSLDPCAVSKKYGDNVCDGNCQQFDPDCKLPDPGSLALLRIYYSYLRAYRLGEVKVGGADVESAFTVYLGYEEYAFDDWATWRKNLDSHRISGLPDPRSGYVVDSLWNESYEIDSFSEGYRSGGLRWDEIDEFMGRLDQCQEEFLVLHQANGICESWGFDGYTAASYFASVHQRAEDEFSKGRFGSGYGQYLDPHRTNDPPLPRLLKACFELSDSTDCASVAPDVCIAEKKYSNGSCDPDCAVPDPDCVVRQASGLATIMGAEVCLEGTSFCTYSDENGNYQLAGAPPGEYLLIIRKQGRSGQTYAVSQSVVIAAGNVVAVAAKALEESGSISGKALRSDAKNHLGTDVFVPGTSFTAKTDEKGSFILLNVPVGRYPLAAMFPGFEAFKWESVEVKAKSDTKLAEVQLVHAPAEVKPRTVSGQVVDTDGLGVGGAIVSTVPDSEKATADGNGNFVLKGLQPISYVIQANRAGYSSNSRRVDLSATESVDVTILVANFQGRQTNTPPMVQIKGVPTAQPGETITLTAEVADPDSDDTLFARWKANGGTLSAAAVASAPRRENDIVTTATEAAPAIPTFQTQWTAPSQQGVFIVEANATDGKSAGFAFHLITVAQPGNTVRIDTTRPPMPDASLVTVAMNAPGKSDTISGAAKAVEPGASIKIYEDDLLRKKIAEGVANSDGSFDSIDLGDNKGDANDLLYLIVYDAFGNKSDRFFFLNDKRPPEVTLTMQPCSLGTFCYVAGTEASFEFVVNEPDAALECSFNGAAYTACTSPRADKGLAAGNYSLLIRATDRAGNVDLSPAVAAWGVDTVSPSAGTVNVTSTATVTHVDSPFDLSANFSESGSGIDLCEYCKSTDGTCDSEWTTATFLGGTCSWTGITCTDAQSLTLNMRATDKKGNNGTGTAASRTCDTSVGSVTVRDAIGGDQDIQTKTTSLAGGWTTASDTSGVDRYEFAVGTTTCSGASPSNITAFASNSLNTSFSLGALSLTQGTSYYVNVKTFDKVGNSRCDSSDGIMVVSQAAVVTGNAGRYTAIAVDSNGKTHISYYDVTNGDLKYAYNTTGTWTVESVDTGGDVGQYTSVALDSSNKAHISYYDATNTALKYATNSSGSWVATTVDNTGTDLGQYTSLALDSNGKVHIAYYDVTDADLEYATNASGSWVITANVDAGGNVGTYASIAVGTDNKAYVAYYDVTNTDPKYATNASGAWVAATIDTAPGAGTSIALDSGNKAHVSFWDNANTDQRYATNASGSWVVSTMAFLTGATTPESSIKVDSNGKVHACHQDVTDLDLLYSTNTSGAWTNTRLDSTGNVGRYCSIALDPGGNPHISYTLDPTVDSDLKYIAVNP